MAKHSASVEVSAETTTSSSGNPSGPIVLELKKKKKKKAFSSSFMRSAQELEGGLTKSSRKVARAVRDALDEYEARRDESADEKKDGAFRDMLHNTSKALRKGLPIAAEAPSDFLDAVADMKAVRKFWRK
jgi:hypothetical protein